MHNTLKFSYMLFIFLVFGLINTQAQQALIPYPQYVRWAEGSLALNHGVFIEIHDEQLKVHTELVHAIFKSKGIKIISNSSNSKTAKVHLRLVPNLTGTKGEQGYALKIDTQGIHIMVQKPEAAFYALQTLRQFTLEQKKIDFCDILDYPAFSWRAFLVDVGRNYQPLEMLKRQIDVMANYKLNVLHFHFTEDIAWRLVSQRYPGLTAASNMTRWKGKSYSIEEFKELIDYCKKRHILFLPEIDMPGHSQAFERYFGVNMQSEKGIIYIKELLKEFRDTYPELEHLHIGGDEVKINNKNFMPEITQYVEDLGYKTYGWDPGSNLEPSTVRQLWMGGPKPIEEKGNLVYIDSKHLYINHMDPLESVTTLFFRKIGEIGFENKNLIGATLCSWPDRSVNRAEDMFYQNAIYPDILTFSERVWRGGGESGWKANLPQENSASLAKFIEFENRLLIHKSRFFSKDPFPYQKQTDMHWEIIGPFANSGNLKTKFEIEENPYASVIKVAHKAIGGTVILRHWWADIIPGILQDPQENCTWYARTKIWSDQDVKKAFWIGFGNQSRSYASDSPPIGKWDNLESQVYVNNSMISPPLWASPGKTGDSESPLIDEGYSFRKPNSIQLKKGWNEVLIKLPVGNFKGKNWQNPVKWMFTFLPYQ